MNMNLSARCFLLIRRQNEGLQKRWESNSPLVLAQEILFLSEIPRENILPQTTMSAVPLRGRGGKEGETTGLPYENSHESPLITPVKPQNEWGSGGGGGDQNSSHHHKFKEGWSVF